MTSSFVKFNLALSHVLCESFLFKLERQLITFWPLWLRTKILLNINVCESLKSHTLFFLPVFRMNITNTHKHALVVYVLIAIYKNTRAMKLSTVIVHIFVAVAFGN